MAVQEILNAPFTDPFARVRNIQSQTTLQKQGQQAGRELVGAMEDVSQAERAEAEAIATARRAQLAKQKEVTDAEVLGKTTAYDAFEAKTGKMPERTITAFNPERATELAVLTAIMGAFAGSISGRAGMSAMKGISEGYRSGQEDLYKREVDNFNAAMDKYKQEISEAKQVLVNAIEKETLKRGAADVELAGLDPQLAGPVIAAHLKSKHLQRAFTSVETKEKILQQMQLKSYEAGLPRASSQQIKTAQVRGGDGKNYLVDVNTFPFGADPSQPNIKGVIGLAAIKAGEAGSRERTFAQRVFSSIKGMAVDAKNLLTIPSTAAMPELAGITANDPNTVFGALVAMTARNVTLPESRAFQQITEQIAQAMANIEGQGLASGSTLAKVKAFDALRPKAGDNALNMALYFARVRQELETGIEVFLTNYGANDEQKKQASEILRVLPQQIPFTVNDVFKAFQQSTNVNKTLNEELKSLVTSAPALLDVQRQQGQEQQPQQGRTATMGNVRATARARNITEDEAKSLYQQRGFTITGE